MRTCFAIVYAFLCPLALSQNATLVINPPSQQIAIDSNAILKVRIQTTAHIHAYHIEVTYNRLLLKCVLVDKATFFPFGSSLLFVTIDSANGKISIDEALIGQEGRSGEGDLVEIKFRGMGNGTIPITLPIANLRDTLNQTVAYSATGGTVRVGTGTAVLSEPAARVGGVNLDCYPNLFNASMTIVVPGGEQQASLRICNLLGQTVRTFQNLGDHTSSSRVIWDGRDDGGQLVSSGAYVVLLARSGQRVYRRIQFIK